MKKYYGVIYLKTGEMCVKGFGTEQACIDAMKQAVAKDYGKIEATTYMVRDAETAGKFLFGHPRTRDLIQDKKFIKWLEENK